MTSPAILPATLTLLERKDGTAAAVRDIGGAVLGGVGLVGFAPVAAATLGVLPAPAALAAALAAWLVLSFALYAAGTAGAVPFLLLQEDIEDRRHGRGGPPAGTSHGARPAAAAAAAARSGSEPHLQRGEEAGPSGPASPAPAGHRAEGPRPRPPYPRVPDA